MLSRIANEFAAEIAYHDWSDAPWRLDRAGHRREFDTNKGAQTLDPRETERVRANVMWIAAQVLSHSDQNLDLDEFAAACGVRMASGTIRAGIRMADHQNGIPARPGPPSDD